MNLPQELLDFAKIENKVKIIGIIDHIELWNPEIYQQYLKKETRSFEEITEQVMTGIIVNEKENTNENK
jgi:MraZ protein